MIEKPYFPDYVKRYPELSDRKDVVQALRKSDRKMKYLEVDIKNERFVSSQKRQIARFIPSREDSYDRLIDEENREFSDEADVEESIVLQDSIQQLHQALLLLTENERLLIEALFYQELTERQYSKQTGIPQKTINDRRHRILAKLKKIMQSKK